MFLLRNAKKGPKYRNKGLEPSFSGMVNFVIDTNEMKIFSKLEEFINFPLVSINIIPHRHIRRMFSFPVIDN